MATCTTPTTGATAQAEGNIAGFKATADSMISATQDALDDLSSAIYIRDRGINTGDLGAFHEQYNAPGDLPSFSYSLDLPVFDIPALEYSNLDVALDISDKPVNRATKLPFNSPQKPGDLTATAPGDVPSLSNPIFPDDLDLATIDDPIQYGLTIPTAPNISLPKFTAIPPDSSGLIVPGNTFYWDEIDYSSPLLTEVQTTVAEFLNGGVGIPDAIWDAIWDRASEKEDKSAIKLIQEVTEHWGAKGFSLPQGPQNASIQEAYQKVLDARSTLARDISEKQAVHEIENLKFAIQQGIVLETMVGGWYQQKTARMLDAAKYTFDATIKLFESSIALYNSELQLYQTEAQVYKSLLEASVVELGLYKTELEAQALLNDINKQNVDIYIAKHDALKVQIDLYNSKLQSVKMRIDVDQARLSAFKISVDAYGMLVAAKSQEYDAYVAQLKAEETKANIYGIEVSAFATEISAYKTGIDAEVSAQELYIKNADLQLKELAAKLEHFNTNVKAGLSQLEANIGIFESKEKAYNINAGNEAKRLDTLIKMSELNLQYADIDTKAHIADGQLDLEATKAEAAFGVKAAESVAAINAQIGSAAMAAINVSASISDTAGETVSCKRE